MRFEFLTNPYKIPPLIPFMRQSKESLRSQVRLYIYMNNTLGSILLILNSLWAPSGNIKSLQSNTSAVLHFCITTKKAAYSAKIVKLLDFMNPSR